MSPIPTLEHLTAYLTGRGWRPPPNGRFAGPWIAPDGSPAFLYGSAKDWHYQRFLATVAEVEGRGELEVALDIEGHRITAVDFDALGPVLAMWVLARRRPESLARLTEQNPLVGFQAVPAAERIPLLAELRDQIDRLAALIDPASSDTGAAVTASDARERRKVWAEQLDAEPWFARWPQPIQHRITVEIVTSESVLMSLHLEQHQAEDREDAPHWSWDPATATVSRSGGHVFRPVPDPDRFLTYARQELELELRDCEATAVTDWLKTLADTARDPQTRSQARALRAIATPPVEPHQFLTDAVAPIVAFAHTHAAGPGPVEAAFPAPTDATEADTGAADHPDATPRPEPERSP